VQTRNGRVISEGCGKCHISGMYSPPLLYMATQKITEEEIDAIDCLICHAREYDMSKKKVFKDEHGYRWGQDRSMRAAVSAGHADAQACLRCHVETFTTKRATPYTPEEDVHAKAGLNCTTCHISEGHLIAKGRFGTDLVTEDLPEVKVSCEGCHTLSPHKGSDQADTLNTHTAKLSCEACHITQLGSENWRYRDWSKPIFNEAMGIYQPTTVITNETKEALTFRWFDGTSTVMAQARGARTDGKSRVYPFKLFQAVMPEDAANRGPTGGMLLPIDRHFYYREGNPDKFVRNAMEKPFMKLMYGEGMAGMMMKGTMNKMMRAIGLEGFKAPWGGNYVWSEMRGDATLMVNHAIKKNGRECASCHTSDGIIDFKNLGYSTEEIQRLTWTK